MNGIKKKTLWLFLLCGLSGISYHAMHSRSPSMCCSSPKRLGGSLGSITKGIFSFFALYAMHHGICVSALEGGIHTIGGSDLSWVGGPSLVVDEDNSIWIASTVSREGNMSSTLFVSEVDRSDEVKGYALVSEEPEVSYGVAKSSNSTLTLLGKTYHTDNHTWDMTLTSLNTTSYLTERVRLQTNSTYEIMSFTPTDEGNAVMVGSIHINGSEDFLVTQLDATRNITWSKAFGGYEREGGTSISLGMNNSVRSVGYTYSYGQKARWLLIHLDEAGEEISTKTISGDMSMYPEEIVAYGEGSLVIGYKGSRGNETFVLANFNANDTLHWAKAMPRASGVSVAVHEDGTITIKVYIRAHGGEPGKIIVAQLSPMGILQSTQAFVRHNSTKGRSVATTAEGDTLVVDLTDTEELLLANIPRTHTEGCDVPADFEVIDITESLVVENVSLNVSYPSITINVSYAQAVPFIIEKSSRCLFTQNPTSYPTAAPLLSFYNRNTTTTPDGKKDKKKDRQTVLFTIGIIGLIVLCYGVAFCIVVYGCPVTEEKKVVIVHLNGAKYRSDNTVGTIMRL